jgi:MFS transporter, DHA1 family, multidrug resistance protein
VSFIYLNRYGLTSFMISLAIAGSAVGYLIGTSIATRIVVRAGIVRTMGFGAAFMLAGALAVCAAVALDISSAIPIAIGIGINLVGFGLLFPQAIAGGLSCAAERVGAASSLLGFAPQISAALLGAWVMASTESSGWPAAIALFAMALLVAGLWIVLRLAPARRPV